jgi:hypothetical protein
VSGVADWSDGRVAFAARPAVAFYPAAATRKAGIRRKGGCDVGRKHKENPAQGFLFDRWDGEPPRPRGYARRRHFAAVPPPDEAAAVVRGALADALERSFTAGPLGDVLWQGESFLPHVRAFVEELTELARDDDRAGVVLLLRRWGLDVYQALALALFPELYCGDPLAVGIVPAGVPDRACPDRMKAFAALLADVAKAC